MHSVMRVTVAATVLGIASLSLAASAHAGNGSAVGAGLLGFGVGAIVGNALAPQTVYVAPPPPVYPRCFTERYNEWVPGWGWQPSRRTVCH